MHAQGRDPGTRQLRAVPGASNLERPYILSLFKFLPRLIVLWQIFCKLLIHLDETNLPKVKKKVLLVGWDSERY